MKRILILCTILAGVFAFAGYGGDSSQSAKPIAISGFGGYTLGGKLDPSVIDQEMRGEGYVRCKAKTQFRNFENLYLYFTPKTLIIYRISSEAEGGSGELAIIKASFEKKYKEKMQESFSTYSLSRGNRIVRVRMGIGNIGIYMVDKKLEKQARKEKEEWAQEQVDTTGL